MHTVQQLLFAQHFPFSSQARHIVKEENLSLEDLPEPVIDRAELMVRSAFDGKKYSFELKQSELLLQEILAFPVAKIIVSFAGDPVLYQRFSKMVADSGYDFLGKEREKGKAAVGLAADFGLTLDFPADESFFVSLSLNEFLSIPFKDESLKLVNQFVSNGVVFLDLNDFCKFLREKSFSLVRNSLPVQVKGLPKRLQAIANNLKAASKEREKKVFFRVLGSAEQIPAAQGRKMAVLVVGQP